MAYAYVKYLYDDSKQIVPVKFISNFHVVRDSNNDIIVNKEIKHRIFWTSAYDDEETVFHIHMEKSIFDKSMLELAKPSGAKKKGRRNKKDTPPDGFYEGNVLLVRGKYVSCSVLFIVRMCIGLVLKLYCIFLKARTVL